MTISRGSVSFFTALLAICLLAESCGCFSIPDGVAGTRREWVKASIAGVVAGSAWVGGGSTLPDNNAVAAVISSKYCASGQGDGCGDLAEGNEFIKSLQQKSAANAEKYAEQARSAYYMKNYPDFFETTGKKMVKKTDGSFFLVDDLELKKLMDGGKITTEIPRAMGGKVVDLTQKPILVLKD